MASYEANTQVVTMAPQVSHYTPSLPGVNMQLLPGGAGRPWKKELSACWGEACMLLFSVYSFLHSLELAKLNLGISPTSCWAITSTSISHLILMKILTAAKYFILNYPRIRRKCSAGKWQFESVISAVQQFSNQNNGFP